MSRWMRATALITLVTFVSGCSGYRVAVVPGTTDPARDIDAASPVVAIGMTARVHLKSGKVQTGEVLSFDNEAITLGNPGNYGLQETMIQFSEIEKIEVESASKTESTALAVLAVTSFVAIGFILLLLATIDVKDDL